MTAYVLVVRHPDASNNITTDGNVEVVDLDLGSSINGSAVNLEDALDFASSVDRLDVLPFHSPLFAEAVDVFREAVGDFLQAQAHIDGYVAERSRKA
jgi:hypothetical protein